MLQSISFKWFFLIGGLLAVLMLWRGSYLLSKFSSGFRFEAYLSAESAKAELLRRFPIGSSSEAIVAELANAGAKISDNQNEFGRFVNCRYLEQHYLWQYQWAVGVKLDESDRIAHLSISRYYLGF